MQKLVLTMWQSQRKQEYKDACYKEDIHVYNMRVLNCVDDSVC